MNTEIASALLTAFQVEYGQDATLHLLATDDDDTAHIEVRGPAIKTVLASDVDEETAELFAHAPDLAESFLRVSAERDRLARTLAVERGDESQAPEGWACMVEDEAILLWVSSHARVEFEPEGGVSEPWRLWSKRVGSIGWFSGASDPRYSTALEAMEAADAARAAVSPKETPPTPT